MADEDLTGVTVPRDALNPLGSGRGVSDDEPPAAPDRPRRYISLRAAISLALIFFGVILSLVVSFAWGGWLAAGAVASVTMLVIGLALAWEA